MESRFPDSAQSERRIPRYVDAFDADCCRCCCHVGCLGHFRSIHGSWCQSDQDDEDVGEEEKHEEPTN